MFFECPECGMEVDEEDIEFECPFCGEEEGGDGFFICEDCGTIFDYGEYLWVCEFCNNGEDDEETEEISQQDDEEVEEEDCCPDCGCELVDYSYCYECGWPNNQAWVAEQEEPFHFQH